MSTVNIKVVLLAGGFGSRISEGSIYHIVTSGEIKMKIAILTQPLHNNYGGLLQNYALQQLLKDKGYEVETVDWKTKHNVIRLYLAKCKHKCLCFIKGIKGKNESDSCQPKEEELLIISKNTRRFIENHLSICPKQARSIKDFKYVDEKYRYDAYVVGSDQVWRPRYNSMLSAMFLEFVRRNNVKRIAYAASFGTSQWEYSYRMTKKYAKLVKRFDLITVREASGVSLCSKYLGVNAMHVLDPTMLINREDYAKLVLEEKEPQSHGSLFYYILDPNDDKKAMVEFISRRNNLIPFTIMPKYPIGNLTRHDIENHIDDCVYPSVTSWLRGFIDAEMVVVDSFHGAVFSIIFNKPFWVIGNKKRGNARFESLLGMFGLEDRLIEPGQNVDWKRRIDWQSVNEICENEKKRCKELLKATL